MREYLYKEDLADLTPWTPDATQSMISRGELKLGVHYFQPGGPKGRLIFKWSAIVAYIEGRDAPRGQSNTIPLVNGGAIDLEETAKEIHRLLG